MPFCCFVVTSSATLAFIGISHSIVFALQLFCLSLSLFGNILKGFMKLDVHFFDGMFYA